MSIQVGDEVMIFIDYSHNKLFALEDIKIFSLDCEDATLNYVLCEAVRIEPKYVELKVISDVIPNDTYEFFAKYNRVTGISYLKNDNIKVGLNRVYLKSAGLKHISECEEYAKKVLHTINAKYEEIEKIINDINNFCTSNDLPAPKNFSEELRDKSLDLVENLGWSTSSFFC